MLGEITHLQTLTDDLKMLTMDPHKLPASSEQVQLPDTSQAATPKCLNVFLLHSLNMSSSDAFC